MRRRGPSWENYEKTVAEAKTAQEQLATAQQELADLNTLNKQMLTEMQVDCAEPTVPVSDAKFVNGLGKFMVPIEGSLTNHYRLIYDRSNELDFWPQQSPAFDGLVAQTFLDPAFSRSTHPKYFDYEPLRDNIATVRNYALQVALDGVDTSDPKQIDSAARKMEQMGREIGVALQRDSLFRRPGSDHIDVAKASIPGEGAAEIYALLAKKQSKNKVLHSAKALFGYDFSEWNLPPIENSPFSKHHIEEFCLGDFSTPDSRAHLDQNEAMAVTRAAKKARTQADSLLEQQQQPAMENTPQQPLETSPEAPAGLSAAQKISVLGAAIAGSAYSLDRVKRLPSPVKQRSVDLARDILDKMRVSVGDADRNQWLERPAEESLAQGEAIASLAGLYAESYQAALQADPNIKHDPSIQQGNEAMGKLAYMVKQQAVTQLISEGKTDDAEMMMAELEQYPESWKEADNTPVAELLNRLQNGLETSHASVQKAQQQHIQLQSQLAQEANSQGPRPRAPQEKPATQPEAPLGINQEAPSPAMKAETTRTVAGNEKMTPEMLEALLQNGGLSQQDLAAVRHMQSQASAMPDLAAQQQSHAANIGRSNASEHLAPQPNYRSAVQNQQREAESLKR